MIGCPECGSIDGIHHRSCTYPKRHPTLGEPLSNLRGRWPIYLASPYTDYAPGHHRAYCDVAHIAGRMVSAGLLVYSPIVYGHALARESGLNPLDRNIWVPLNEPFLEMSQVLVVALMVGWEHSRDIAYEISESCLMGKPAYTLSPRDMLLHRQVYQSDASGGPITLTDAPGYRTVS